jgi:hypothetical protein
MMRIKGKLNIEAEDILFYNSVASVAKDISKRVADELTPTFIIREAMDYFSDKEEYEICHLIKSYFENNPSFFIDITRAEWFGTLRTREKK